MQDETKPKVMNRLNRIEGQVRGIARMVEEDRYCVDVLTQLQAVRAALSRVETEVLRDHLGPLRHGRDDGRRSRRPQGEGDRIDRPPWPRYALTHLETRQRLRRGSLSP